MHQVIDDLNACSLRPPNEDSKRHMSVLPQLVRSSQLRSERRARHANTNMMSSPQQGTVVEVHAMYGHFRSTRLGRTDFRAALGGLLQAMVNDGERSSRANAPRDRHMNLTAD
jgi:hypothetical protein